MERSFAQCLYFLYVFERLQNCPCYCAVSIPSTCSYFYIKNLGLSDFGFPLRWIWKRHSGGGGGMWHLLVTGNHVPSLFRLSPVKMEAQPISCQPQCRRFSQKNTEWCMLFCMKNKWQISPISVLTNCINCRVHLPVTTQLRAQSLRGRI
jgi:hypothetical protein